MNYGSQPIFFMLALLALALPALSQQGAVPAPETGPIFQVDYSNPGISPSHWTLTLHSDGTGHFRSERGKTALDQSPKTFQGIDAPSLDRNIQVSAGFAQYVFQTAHDHQLFQTQCESHMKVAFEGWKKLSYSGPDGAGGCEFNYSKDKQIQALGDSLVAVAGTIVEGARLEMLLQHDPLGLDSEMEFLAEASGDGRVQQICAIRGILERLADDPSVLDRVRRRAKLLLASREQ
jgi:hypothetical protein